MTEQEISKFAFNSLASPTAAKKPTKRGRLSRYYPSKSRSFPQLSEVWKTEHGESALALGKKRTATGDVLSDRSRRRRLQICLTQQTTVAEQQTTDALQRLSLIPTPEGQQQLYNKIANLANMSENEPQEPAISFRCVRRKHNWSMSANPEQNNEILEREL